MTNRIMFPPVVAALQKELNNHPDLIEQLRTSSSFEESLGTIGAYLGIALDGIYGPLDLMDLFVREFQRRDSAIVGKDKRLLTISNLLGADGKPIIVESGEVHPKLIAGRPGDVMIFDDVEGDPDYELANFKTGAPEDAGEMLEDATQPLEQQKNLHESKEDC